jgi:hypothetical protein
VPLRPEGRNNMEAQEWYTSYVLRAWWQVRADGEDKPPIWQGEVIHIQSGRKTEFHELRELLRTLEEQMNPVTTNPEPGLGPTATTVEES